MSNYFSMPWSVEFNLVVPRDDFEKNVKIDVSKWAKSKQGLSYIPWNVAVGLLRNYNPSLYVACEEDNNGQPFFKTETGVYLKVFVFDKSTGKRTPPLIYAVRTNTNKSDPNPNIDTITNSIQRAYAKVIAQEVGFGWSLYSKFDESIDFDDEPRVQAVANGNGKAAVSPRPTATVQPKQSNGSWDF